MAARAGVSKSLVSLVLSDSPSVGSASRAAVLEAVEELNYRPNAMARSLAQQRTRMIGVLISDLRNPFFGDISSGIMEGARQAGYNVVFSTGDRQRSLEENAIDALLELRADGLILAGPQVEEEVLERAGREVPLVVLNRPLTTGACDSVTNDDLAGGRLAVLHCAELGHRRIAHIDGGGGAGAALRRRGYEDAMEELGLGGERLVVEGSFTEEGGYRGARRLMERGELPTAIFAANDLAAVGVLSALEESGRRIPEDVSLVGYDNSSLAKLRHLSLTSVDQPAMRIGQMAVERFLERLDEGRTQAVHEVIAPSLAVRSSTAAPPSPSEPAR